MTTTPDSQRFHMRAPMRSPFSNTSVVRIIDLSRLLMRSCAGEPTSSRCVFCIPIILDMDHGCFALLWLADSLPFQLIFQRAHLLVGGLIYSRVALPFCLVNEVWISSK